MKITNSVAVLCCTALLFLTCIPCSPAWGQSAKPNVDKSNAGKAKKDKRKAAILDPAKADKDFGFQGEYEGTLGAAAGNIKLGVQLIALGDGKFSSAGYTGGLPGSGWDGSEIRRSEGTGEIKDGVFRFQNDHAVATVKDGTMQIDTLDGIEMGQLKRVERKSKTLGMKPPSGAVVLFDGSSADNFKNGKLDGKLLQQGTTSKQTFGDFEMHLEFRTSYMPFARGQGRSNSGVYMQGRYEVQVLDSFGLTGENNECGGIYSIAKPNVNMCYPPLAWQTYDVEFTAARFDADGKKTKSGSMTVRHNGVEIHKDVVLKKRTTASPLAEGVAKGPLYIQNHGNPVRFRNIWVVEK